MKQIIDNITFDDDGLIPAIVQDDQTGDVLMLAYMNKESLLKTIETKETWFFSRSRQELWHKGETSGHKQAVKHIDLDCDQDALLVTIEPSGPACHTGEKSCFYQPIMTSTTVKERQMIAQLIDRIHERRNEPVEGSYTTYLFREGLDKILKKIGEEASEIIIAAKNDDKSELIWEISDLIYHMLVLMEIKDVNVREIHHELAKRNREKER